MAYAVIRTDLMSGTKQPADLVSLRFYKDSDQVAVENGVIAELDEYEENQREVWKAEAATSTSDLSKCVVIAGVELPYDERVKNLDQYINPAGKAVRGYVLRSRNMFSVTKEAFKDSTEPTVGSEVGIGENGKIDGSGSGLGTVVAIEQAGRYKFFTIQIGVTEAAAAPVI